MMGSVVKDKYSNKDTQSGQGCYTGMFIGTIVIVKLQAKN